MATLGATRLTAAYFDAPNPTAGGLTEEVWQVASGGSAGDTIAIAPARGRYVLAAVGGPTSNNISTAGTSTNVTLTISTGTSTVGAFQVRLLIMT